MTNINRKQHLTVKEKIERYFPVYFYRKHLDLAIRDILGLDLSVHARISIRELSSFKSSVIWWWSRGLGKSVNLAALFIVIAILYPRIKLMVPAGQGFRGSKMVLLEAERIIRGDLGGQRRVNYARACLKDRSKIINKDPAFWSVQWANGSIIYGVPLGLGNEGNVIRGLRSQISGEDESFLIPTKLRQAVLKPMQNVLYEPHKQPDEQIVKNMLIRASTCDYSFRDFYKQAKYFESILEKNEIGEIDKEKLKPSDVSYYEFNIDDTYYTNPVTKKKKMTWGIDYDAIMRDKSLPDVDTDIWMAENKNEVMDITGGYFKYEDIEKCMSVCLNNKKDTYAESLSKCSGQCILGIDTAPTGDNTGFVVVKAGMLDSKDRDLSICESASINGACPYFSVGRGCDYKRYCGVLYAYEENSMNQRNRVKKIYELFFKFNLMSIGIDARGGGHELSDLLKDQDFINNLIALGEIDERSKIIYDPNECKIENGLPILVKYSTTQQMNMIFNGYLKALLSNTRMLLPRPLRGRPDDITIFESQGHCETLVNQLARIKAEPKGQGISFFIESVDPVTGKRTSGKKDLYSALLYACAVIRDLIEANRIKEIDYSSMLPLPVMVEI